MIIVTVKRRTVILAIVVIGLMVVSACVAMSMPKLRRMTTGVRPGVTLSDVAVGGLFADEVRQVVLGLAPRVERMPREAMYHSETGEVVSEEPGVAVDVDRTVIAVMAAPRGACIEVTTKQVPPQVTAAMLAPVYRVATSERAVALAFNVAWGEEWLPQIMDVLAGTGVHCSFFITGTWAKKFPELVQALASAGHEIANHGWDHPNPARLGETDLTDLIERNETLLRELTGVRTRLFAPPYGEVNQKVCKVAARLGYTTIMWTVDTVDWQRPAPEVVADRALKRLAGGNIILVHPTEPTAKALPSILTSLSQQGYRAVTVSELLSLGQPAHDRG